MNLSRTLTLTSLIILASQASALPETSEKTTSPKMCSGDSELVRNLNIPYTFLSDNIADDNGSGNTYMDGIHQNLALALFWHSDWTKFHTFYSATLRISPPPRRRSVQMDFSKLPLSFREVRADQPISTHALTNPETGVECWMEKSSPNLLRERKVQTSTIRLAVSDRSYVDIDLHTRFGGFDLIYNLVFENADIVSHPLQLVCKKSSTLPSESFSENGIAQALHRFTLDSLPKEIKGALSFPCDDIRNIEEAMDRSEPNRSSETRDLKSKMSKFYAF